MPTFAVPNNNATSYGVMPGNVAPKVKKRIWIISS